jgi:hypothetical protein
MNGLLDALAHASAPTAGPAGVGWLLPLALATVELEYTVRHGSHVDLRLVAHACDDVRKFLDEDQDPAFAARYAVERASFIDGRSNARGRPRRMPSCFCPDGAG